MFASKNTVVDSALDGLGMGVGFTLALSAMGIIREVFGAGQFFGFDVPFFTTYHFPLLQKTFGGFLVYGTMIALVQAFTRGAYPKKKSFTCEGCPNASICRGNCNNSEEAKEER